MQLEFSFIDSPVNFLRQFDLNPSPFLLKSWLRLACFQEMGWTFEEVGL